MLSPDPPISPPLCRSEERRAADGSVGWVVLQLVGFVRMFARRRHDDIHRRSSFEDMDSESMLSIYLSIYVYYL